MAKYENIENISKMLSDGSFNELTKKISSVEKSAYDVIKKLSVLQADMAAKQAEEKEQEKASVQAEISDVKPAEPASEKALAEEAKAEPAKEKPAEVKEPAKEQVKEQAKEPESAPAVQPKAEEIKPKEAAKPRTEAKEKAKEVKEPEKKGKEEAKAQPQQPKRPSFIVAKASSLPPKTFVNNSDANRSGNRNGGAGGKGAAGARPAAQPRYVAPAAPQPVKPAGKNFGPDKKKGFEKTYVEKDRHAISKRALAKQQGVTVEDFDEDKSGYRKLRVKKDKKQERA